MIVVGGDLRKRGVPILGGMRDPVVEALREIIPVTRGQADVGGRVLRWVESGPDRGARS